MALSLKQEEHYTGQERWKWSVWVDGSQEELDQIDHVVYILHKTFPNPVREIRDRESNFRLTTSSWGTFHDLRQGGAARRPANSART